MEFLTGNPFSTPVGHRIERATSSSLQSEDWALNMEICDIINGTDEGPKDAVRAIKKRIVGNKNFREVMLALTVLEACVKNCGHRFHVLVSTREFIEGVMVRTIIPRNNPPLVLHDRVLSIIQAWADAFRSSPDLTGVVSVYEDLRRKGLEFPMTELDGCSPIYTPHRSLPENGPVVTLSTPPSLKPPPTPPQPSEPEQNQEEAGVFTPYQVKKLKADMGVVQSNLTVMSDMMSQMDPVTAKLTDIELLQQLYTVCKKMQERIVELVPRLSEEKLIEELLAANDEMNTTFTRYQRFERQMTNGQTTAQTPMYLSLTDLNLGTKCVNQSGVAAVPINNFITQSSVESVSSQMARLSTSESDDLDSFSLKSNISQPQQRQSEQREDVVDGLAQAQNTRLQNTGTIPISQSNVMDDIEKWLSVDDEDDDDFEDSDGVTSEAFNKFLAERAKAAERLPSLKASMEDPSRPQS
ncbi:target of Myb1 membrane trafficking protein isoform 2-T2 [Polymixia lowei]